MSGAVFINTLVIDRNPDVWWIDPLVALACGVAALLIGLWHIYVARYRQHIPIFSCRWWISSQGDGTDEVDGRPLGPDNFPGDESGVEMREQEDNDLV